MNNIFYDVAIIGAGPAGSSLAYRLSQFGIKTLVLEKKLFPRKKICAGGLPIKVLDLIPFDITALIENKVFRVKLSYKLKGEFTRHYNKSLICTVDRQKFDDFLVRKAERSGADFWDGEEVQEIKFLKKHYLVYTTNKVIKTRIIVGADGARSIVAKSFGLKPITKFHLGFHTEISTDIQLVDNKTIFLDCGSIPDGYAWIFPKGKFLSIGVGGPLNLSHQLNHYQHKVLSHFGLDKTEIKMTGHLIPHRLVKNPISKDGGLLVGDAAGLADFWTCEGIYYALKSSALAAQVIDKYLKGEVKDFNTYEDSVNKIILPELQTSYYFSKIFNYISSLCFKSIARYDYSWDVFCRIMRGDRTFTEMKKRFRPDIFIKKIFLQKERRKNI